MSQREAQRLVDAIVGELEELKNKRGVNEAVRLISCLTLIEVCEKIRLPDEAGEPDAETHTQSVLLAVSRKMGPSGGLVLRATLALGDHFGDGFQERLDTIDKDTRRSSKHIERHLTPVFRAAAHFLIDWRYGVSVALLGTDSDTTAEVHRDKSYPFLVVDQDFLEVQRTLVKRQFVARSPDWADVVHGEDQSVKFVERDQTGSLVKHIVATLLVPLQRSTGIGLTALFVTGPPGAGKTTLVRRALSLLVDAGQAIVLDLGANHGAIDSAEIDSYLAAISSAATDAPFPVLLLLDDPLTDGGGWPEFLRRLARPGRPRVAAIAATPTLLHDLHRHELMGQQVATSIFNVGRPSKREKQQLGRFHGRALPTNDAGDFLALAMGAATGEAFEETVDRIWMTLNAGNPISSTASPSSLPPLVRLYLIVTYFGRFGMAVPEALVWEAVREIGPLPESQNLEHLAETARMREGWEIFLMRETKGKGSTRLRLIGPNHQVVAREAWRRRPAAAADVGIWIAAATIRQPSTARFVGGLLRQISDQQPSTESSLLEEVARQWEEAVRVGHLQLAPVQALWEGLRTRAPKFKRRRELAARVEPCLEVLEAQFSEQSWLAAVLLNRSHGQQTIQPSRLAELVAIGDLSLAPGEVSNLVAKQPRPSVLRTAVARRLKEALDHRLGWELNTRLFLVFLANAEEELPVAVALEWLASKSPAHDHIGGLVAFLKRTSDQKSPEEIEAGVAFVTAWLNDRPNDHSLRVSFGSFLKTIGHPSRFDHLKHVLDLPVSKKKPPIDLLVMAMNIAADATPEESTKALRLGLERAERATRRERKTLMQAAENLYESLVRQNVSKGAEWQHLAEGAPKGMVALLKRGTERQRQR